MNFEENLRLSLPEEDVSSLLQALEQEPTHALILNEAKISKEEFLADYPRVERHPIIPNAFLYEKEVYDFGKYPYYQAGAYSIQEPAAMLPGYFLPFEKGDHVLDLCAAPGGKSIEIALRLEGSGVLLANDLSYKRARELSSNIERMGLGNVVVSSNDFSTIDGYDGYFDAILLDAPCSGSAMFRKNDLAKTDWSYEKVLRQAAIQKELIERSYELLSPGGYLLYSTCSFSIEENEGIILPFLGKHPDMKAVPLPSFPGFSFGKDLPEAVHLYPHLFPGEGQFLCLLKKDGEKRGHASSKNKMKKHLGFLRSYGLEERDNRILHGALYSLSEPFPIKGLNILRYGMPLLDEEDKKEEPSHHLSHYLPSSDSLPLSPNEARDYLAGLSFPYLLPVEDGYHIVSLDGVNLGWAKITHGMLKNHYPKGLRVSIR